MVDDYADDASGIMAKNADGRLAMTSVTLRPRVTFQGAKRPDRAALDALHHAAHEECFIAGLVGADDGFSGVDNALQLRTERTGSINGEAVTDWHFLAREALDEPLQHLARGSRSEQPWRVTREELEDALRSARREHRLEHDSHA